MRKLPGWIWGTPDCDTAAFSMCRFPKVDDRGRETQFDPVFAKIMLDMIDEDAEYQMRER